MKTKLQQFKAALRVLREDCAIEGKYCQGRKTCAIGALALASGVKRSTLAEIEGVVIEHEGPFSEVRHVREAISAKFGFTTRQMADIQDENDGVSRLDYRLDHVKRRRLKVCGLVQRWINRLKG